MLGTPGKVPSSQYEEVSHSELDYHGIVGLDLQEDTFAASPMLDNAMEASSVVKFLTNFKSASKRANTLFVE